MAISENLKELYSSNPDNVEAYDTIILTHSRFSRDYYLIKSNKPHTFTRENGEEVEFEPFPFSFELPEVGSSQQDMQLVFDAVGGEVVKELEAASMKMDEPILLAYSVYIDGDTMPQHSPIKLTLRHLVVSSLTVTCTASRSDLYQKRIPTGVTTLFDQKYRGLWL